MSLKKTLADSTTEGRLIGYLNDCWRDKVVVLMHQAVKDVIILDDEELTNNERRYLENTHFDFVITTQVDLKPLLVIEFDGMEGGYSANGEYVLTKDVLKDSNRKWKFDLKINICEKNNIPIAIIGWNEIEGQFEKEIATVINGIIGKALFEENFNKLFQKNDKDFNNKLQQIKDPEEQQLLVDSFGLDCEFEAMNSSSIITQEINTLYSQLCDLGVIRQGFISGFGPVRKGELGGARYTVRIKEQEMSEEVYIRGVSTLDIDWFNIALEIAELKLLRKLVIMYEEKG